MSDLISRSALRSLFIEVMEHIKENPKMTRDEIHIISGCHMLCEMIDDAPAVDAVPVVRCRECKEWKHGLCRLLCADTPEDGYCFCGEKMDGGAKVGEG